MSPTPETLARWMRKNRVLKHLTMPEIVAVHVEGQRHNGYGPTLEAACRDLLELERRA